MKTFNINAGCDPDLHYMVDITPKLNAIRKMVEQGLYFTINKARQYGKTTILQALAKYLKDGYTVISLDFQMLSSADFENEAAFAEALSSEILDALPEEAALPEDIKMQLEAFAQGQEEKPRLSRLFRCLSRWCESSAAKIVLTIDEADSAANNTVFLDFLSLLRGYYIQRKKKGTFHSVILSGVYNIKNIKQKFSEDKAYQTNSPWNIAADFLVDMHFSPEEIEGMLTEYENDHNTGMNTREVAGLLYDYTSGYPFLVSKLCKLMDEQLCGSPDYPAQRDVWTKSGVLKAVNLLLSEKNTLFDSLIGKLQDYPDLKNILYALLFSGQNIVYNPDDSQIDIALMFGFVKIENGSVEIANRIFETRLYNFFLTTSAMQNTTLYKAALQSKNQFVSHGRLNMKRILETFVLHFDEIYGDSRGTFYEEDGRKFFLLYLRPIINGSGNYYVESRTRNMERTDIIVDYQGEQFVIELKIWRGNAYHTRGEEQLLNYLEYYHLQKGYMISFNFNQKKQTGVQEISLNGRTLIEAVV